MRIAIIGSGPAGQVAAACLARAGHGVTLFERAPALGPVGAGLLIQPTGRAVLAELGLADDFERVSSPVGRLLGTNLRGRTVLDLSYADLGPGVIGRGIHRAGLAAVLARAVEAAGVETRLSVEVDACDQSAGEARLHDSGGADLGAFDLVVAASGARCRLRRALPRRLVRRDRSYPWGALWFVGPDAEGSLSGVLRQVYRGTKEMIGFLPSGRLDGGGGPNSSACSGASSARRGAGPTPSISPHGRHGRSPLLPSPPPSSPGSNAQTSSFSPPTAMSSCGARIPAASSSSATPPTR